MAFLCVVGFSFLCWVLSLLRWVLRLVLFISGSWADFRLGMLLGILGGSLASRALYTPHSVLFFAAVLFLKSSKWWRDLFVGSFWPVCAGAVTQVVTPEATQQDDIPVVLSRATTVIHSPAAASVQVSVPVSLRSPPPYFSHEMMCSLVLPYLDSFEVVLTTTAFFKYVNCTPAVSAWYRRYLRSHVGFVADVANRVVRTSAGAVVHPELGNVMRVQTLTSLPSSLSHSTITVATYRDLDSLACDYCGKRRHLAPQCWKRLQDEKRKFRRSRGASATNSWGWGTYHLFPDDFVPIVCSDAFGIRPRGGVSVSEL